MPEFLGTVLQIDCQLAEKTSVPKIRFGVYWKLYVMSVSTLAWNIAYI